MSDNLIVSPSPHLHKDESVTSIMWMVVLSLVPAGIAATAIFGLSALRVTLVAIISAVLTEAIIQLSLRRSGKRLTVFDGSAFLTGLLLAYNLPPGVPIFMPVVGSIFAIAIAKHAFGGLGQNIFNPALAGRVFLMASWPAYMTNFPRPFTCDAITSATPLALLKESKSLGQISYLDLFLGRHGGCIGEVCILALLLGAIFLLIRGYISWHIPFSYVATCGLLAYIFGPQGFFSGDWLFHILSGGLILGAFFMATDYVTCPLTRKGQLVFGIGCGLITMVIRLRGGYPEGVSYAILMMNAATPLIDRYTRNRVYGTK
ncbi:MAG: RnfABCDGE type electron transport complex subunit D [Candidatus Omnitrophica bacterium]|nr:RnfABCDGE type electron transport complex subunit D [Candidatus Omnitrophota bacterium]